MWNGNFGVHLFQFFLIFVICRPHSLTHVLFIRPLLRLSSLANLFFKVFFYPLRPRRLSGISQIKKRRVHNILRKLWYFLDEVWNQGMMFSQLLKRSTCMLVNSIFKHLRTFVVVLNALSKFSKTVSVFIFRWSVWCQHLLKLYSIERTNNFGYIFSWSCQVWLLAPTFFPNVKTSSV